MTWYLRGKAMAKAFMLLWEMKEDLSFLMILQKTVGSIEGNYGIGRCISCQRRKVIQMLLQQKGPLVCLFRGRIRDPLL